MYRLTYKYYLRPRNITQFVLYLWKKQLMTDFFKVAL